MDPTKEIERGRSFKAIETSYRTLLPFRELNRSLVEEYAGGSYGPTGRVRRDDMLNLMNQAVDAYQMALVANRPRVLVSTENDALEYFAKHFALAVNNFIKDISLEGTLKRWVLDAFFCVGVIKLHRADSGEVLMVDDRRIDPGVPFASNVSLDNWVYDVGANEYEKVKYAGDMYRVPFASLHDDSIFDQSVVDTLVPTSKFGVEGDRLEEISRGYEVDNDEFEPMIDLADLWIPADKKIYTFAVDNVAQFRLKGEPLAAIDDDEYPEFGPYAVLGFNDVPENIMPVSPASHLSMLHRLVNNLMRKQGRRARSQKKMHTYTPAAAESAKRMQRADDDTWIDVQDPQEIGEVNVGGVDQATQAFMLGTMEMFDRMAGNLTAMMGLGSQASTVGQEQIIQGSVSKKEASMQFRVVDGCVKIIRTLGCMLWHDKFKTIEGQMPIEGVAGYSVDATWTPDDRDGKFCDYLLDIDLYSMPYQTPQQKAQAILQLLTQVYAPFGQMLVAQGGTINLQKLTELLAELTNMPQLRGIVEFSAVPQAAGGGGDDGGEDDGSPGLPANTTRNYVRRSVPTGGTSASRSHVQQQMWMAGANNQQQAASMGRPAA